MAELDACRAEVLGRSASIVQRKVRTYLCQKHYNLLRLSAIELQRVARGINYMNPLALFIVERLNFDLYFLFFEPLLCAISLNLM